MKESNVNYRRKLRWVLVGMAITYGAIVLALSSAWYADQMLLPFHFFNDLPEWKQLDKFAHLFWAFNVCALASRLLNWGGLKNANEAGTAIGFFIVSFIEVLDGFSIGYGASVFDIVANALGSLLFLGQLKVWKRIKFFSKASFHFTSFAIMRPSLLGDGFFQEMLKDYNGQTFWYSWSPEKKWWPAFLSIAIGVGAEGMIYGRDAENVAHHFSPYRKYFISLDLNPSYFQSSNSWLQALIYPLTFFKCPAPALEFSANAFRLHWIYF